MYAAELIKSKMKFFSHFLLYLTNVIFELTKIFAYEYRWRYLFLTRNIQNWFIFALLQYSTTYCHCEVVSELLFFPFLSLYSDLWIVTYFYEQRSLTFTYLFSTYQNPCVLHIRRSLNWGIIICLTGLFSRITTVPDLIHQWCLLIDLYIPMN